MLLFCEPFPSVMDKVTSFTLLWGEGKPSIYPLVLSSFFPGLYELQWNFFKTNFTRSSFIVCHKPQQHKICILYHPHMIQSCSYKALMQNGDKYYQSCFLISCHVHVKVTRLVGCKTCPVPESSEIFHKYTDISFTPDLNTKFCALCPIVLADDIALFKDGDCADVSSSLTKQPHFHDPGFSKAYAILCSGF